MGGTSKYEPSSTKLFCAIKTTIGAINIYELHLNLSFCQLVDLPLTIEDESLHLSNEIRHCWGHLYFFLGMKQTTQVYGTYLYCAMTSQNCLRYIWKWVRGIHLKWRDEIRYSNTGWSYWEFKFLFLNT